MKLFTNEQNLCNSKRRLLFQKAQNEQNSPRKFFLVSKRGESYIDMAVIVLASMMIIVIAINVFSLITLNQKLDYFKGELLNTAATYGRISTEVNDRYNELVTQTGISPTVTWTAVYYDTSDKEVQLSDEIAITLTMQTDFQGTGEMSIIPLTLTSKGSALSERYWR